MVKSMPSTRPQGDLKRLSEATRKKQAKDQKKDSIDTQIREIHKT